MQVEYKKRFLKELSKLPKQYREIIEKFVFEELPNLEALEHSGKIEKMRGYKEYYKIRFGDYRVGLKNSGDTVTVEIVLHRREIYSFFP